MDSSPSSSSSRSIPDVADSADADYLQHLSHTRAAMSSKACAFSIAAIMGSGDVTSGSCPDELDRGSELSCVSEPGSPGTQDIQDSTSALLPSPYTDIQDACRTMTAISPLGKA